MELTEENKKQFYIPEGFAHGFLVLSDIAEFCYKCTDFYPRGEGVEDPRERGGGGPHTEGVQENTPGEDMHRRRGSGGENRKRSALGGIKDTFHFLNRHAFERSCQWQVL